MSRTPATSRAAWWTALAAAAGLSCAASSVVPAGADHPGSVDPATSRAGAAPPVEAAAAAEQIALERARPVFERHCARCHSASGERARPALLAHFDITTYPFGGHHAEELGHLVREVLGVTGEPPLMPIDHPGAVHGAELEAVVAWTRAFDRTRELGVHGPPVGPRDGGHGAPPHGTSTPDAGHPHGAPDAGSTPDAGHQHGPADVGPSPEAPGPAGDATTHDHDGHDHGRPDAAPAPDVGGDGHNHGGH